jgi:hypothetical protein
MVGFYVLVNEWYEDEVCVEIEVCARFRGQGRLVPDAATLTKAARYGAKQ